MAVLRAFARPMLASTFIVAGLNTLRDPGRVAPKAEPVVRPLADRVSIVPDQTEQAVRLNAAVQVVAGSLLALGRLPRLSALAIAATLVPTTYAGHRFWEVDDKQERAQQRIHFLKNLSMFGGLLLAAADTAGNPSLAWRSRHAVKAARHDVSLATRAAKVSGKTGAKAGKLSTLPATTAAKASAKTAKAPGKAAKAAGKTGLRAAGKTGAKKVGPLSISLPIG
ncbi:MAG TPA: DoxX family protein [Streptosporangiaceae bacterium]